MLSERNVHPDVRALLMSGAPFQYAHLIKFERPSRPENATGAVSTSAYKYTYLTDSSRDVSFDDLSKDNAGVANGSQVYIANKVLNVSGMQESIEAKASTFNITLDGNGVGAAVSGTVTITAVDSNHWDISWPTNIDVADYGFREGDKVILTGYSQGSFNIHSFRENNIIRLKKIESTPTVGTGTITMTLSSEEIKSVLLDKKSSSYASFINREVFIYRAYFVDGEMVGETPYNGLVGPILIFKGIISNVNFEDNEGGIKVQWGLTSHWGDFAQVKGRITSDDFHRALNSNGIPQPYSAIKPVYAHDMGFMHAETSLNLLTDYTVKVEKQKVKSKSGFLGIGSKVKVKKYFVDETRYSNLDFQLAARSIPVIYGVRNVEGIPVFADTLLADASSVYVVYALCEGQVGGIYDIYVDSKSLICANESDYDVRHAQNAEGTIDVLCRGRADRGDVLLGTTSVGPGSGSQLYYQPIETIEFGSEYAYAPTGMTTNYLGEPTAMPYQVTYNEYVEPTDFEASGVSGGLTQGKSLLLTTKQQIRVDFFGGTEDQVAAPSLVNIAYNKGFKVQNDYWTGDSTVEYWGPNHRLLDTAYVVANFMIAEGETSIPTLEFIVRGKILDCYNYDYSYSHDPKATGESANNFKLGQTVTLKNSATDATIATAQIIDKWNMVAPDGGIDTRFRWSVVPNLGYDAEGVPAITKFYMTNGSQNWTMITFNYDIHNGTVTTELSAPIVDVTPAPPDTGGVVVVTPTQPTPPPSTPPPAGTPPPVYTPYPDDGTPPDGGVYIPIPGGDDADPGPGGNYELPMLNPLG